jgi:hypothetical protein
MPPLVDVALPGAVPTHHVVMVVAHVALPTALLPVVHAVDPTLLHITMLQDLHQHLLGATIIHNVKYASRSATRLMCAGIASMKNTSPTTVW